VIGVSPDTAPSHRRFKAKYALPYTLLCDKGKAIAIAYGAVGEKSMYGRKYLGILRNTYIIDRDGRVARVFENVEPEENGALVADALSAMQLSP
jgi:thioredoxin-dependent peroxiredoxin